VCKYKSLAKICQITIISFHFSFGQSRSKAVVREAVANSASLKEAQKLAIMFIDLLIGLVNFI